MAAITPTKVIGLDVSAGNKKLKVFTVTPGSSSDTIDLSAHFSTIDAVLIPHITAGNDAALQTARATFSSTTVTIETFAAAGTAATDWTGASAQVTVIGEDEAL